MAKDPAFLFYYNDFESDTANWEPEAIGWYMRLLCFQAANGYIPSGLEEIASVARVKISEWARFQELWKSRISVKFSVTLSDTQKLQNNKLFKVQSDRKENAVKKSVLAVFGNFIKSTKLSDSEKNHLKNIFKKTDEFELISESEKRKNRILEFLNNELLTYKNKNKRNAKRTHLENENENENINKTKAEIKKVGEGENLRDQNFDLDLEELKSEIKNQFSWKEKLVKNYREIKPGFGIEALEDYLETFFKLLYTDGEESKNLKGFQKHFNRWLKIQIEKSINNSGNGTQNKSNSNNQSPYSEDYLRKKAERLAGLQS